MATVKLLRVEKDGLGMYRELWWKLGLPTDKYKHPSPYDDTLLHVWRACKSNDSTRFAFGNTQQFLQWVYDPRWRYDICGIGGELWVYEVDINDCHIGEKQAVFLIDKVVSKRMFPVISFDDHKLRPIIEEYLNS